MLSHDQLGGLEAVDVRHVDVHGDHVGPQRFRERDAVAAVAALAHDFELRIGVDDLLKHLAHEGGVIHHEHADFLCRASSSFQSCRTGTRTAGRPCGVSEPIRLSTVAIN